MTDEEFRLEALKFNIEKRKSLLADQMLKCMQHFKVAEAPEVYRAIVKQEGELRDLRNWARMVMGNLETIRTDKASEYCGHASSVMAAIPDRTKEALGKS